MLMKQKEVTWASPLRDTPVVRTDHLDAQKAGELSTLFDVGGIFGESVTTSSAAVEMHVNTRGLGSLRVDLLLGGHVSPRVYRLSGRVPSGVLGPDSERDLALCQVHTVGGRLVLWVP